MFTIEKNVPIAAKRRGRARQYLYPFAAMKRGDSFFVPCPPKEAGAKSRTLISCARYHFGKPGCVTVRTDKVAGGVRCWKV